MLTDTVGFIQKLPTNLVAAFRATLEEVGGLVRATDSCLQSHLWLRRVCLVPFLFPLHDLGALVCLDVWTIYR